MKYCKKCGTPMEDAMAFCPHCGTEQIKSRQGAAVRPETKAGTQRIDDGKSKKLRTALIIFSVVYVVLSIATSLQGYNALLSLVFALVATVPLSIVLFMVGIHFVRIRKQDQENNELSGFGDIALAISLQIGAGFSYFCYITQLVGLGGLFSELAGSQIPFYGLNLSSGYGHNSISFLFNVFNYAWIGCMILTLILYTMTVIHRKKIGQKTSSLFAVIVLLVITIILMQIVYGIAIHIIGWRLVILLIAIPGVICMMVAVIFRGVDLLPKYENPVQFAARPMSATPQDTPPQKKDGNLGNKILVWGIIALVAALVFVIVFHTLNIWLVIAGGVLVIAGICLRH